MSEIIEGRDYYYNNAGLLVFTSSYHLRRGRCCGKGCMHCPYEYLNVPEPARTKLLKERPPVILMEKQRDKGD